MIYVSEICATAKCLLTIILVNLLSLSFIKNGCVTFKI